MFANLTPITDSDSFWVMLVFYLVLAAIFLSPQYIMNSLALYKIAHRRGIRHAWLSWVPLGSDWVLGCISDQYQHRVLGKMKKRRQHLLLLRGLSILQYIVAMVLLFVVLSQADQEQMLSAFSAMLILAVGVWVAVGIIEAVIGWMATYDLFRSCEPKNGMVYIVSIVVIGYVMPMFAIIKEILMLAVSGKDLGMTQPVLPQEPWEKAEEI